ncbi:MAG: ATP-binding cassette domain-containing protein [Lachnospiraceae bacterium]|nr:ATP-binding cassette domain-containing protein [Lachnospiraceae bacterium]
MIRAQNLSYTANKNILLKPVSFSVAPGTMFCMIGSDGSGKTTLLRILAGFIRHYDGTVTIAGSSPSDFSGSFRFVPDTPVYMDDFSVKRYLLNVRQSSPDYIAGLEPSMLNVFGISYDMPIRALSMSQNRSLQLIGAICSNPDILYLDECTNLMEQKDALRWVEILKKFSSRGLTVVTTACGRNPLSTACNSGVLLK